MTRRVPVPLEKTDEGGKSWRAGLGRKTLSSDFNVLNLSYLVVITLNSPGQKNSFLLKSPEVKILAESGNFISISSSDFEITFTRPPMKKEAKSHQ